ncbi:polysaccharide deacetylase family protein [Gammaproteobacteria bacterium]|nr:polysaccharide deacetylase family protein [Gammaproteobacteria bacterium]
MRLLIVNYHYVREVKSGQGIYPITTSELTSQLDLLAKKYKFISQAELLSFFSNKAFPKGDFCLLTFDDGLKEQLKAFDILKKKKIPGIFFISTMPLISRKACAVHKFHYVMEQMSFDRLYDNVLQIFPESIFKLNDLSFQNKASRKYIYDTSNWAKLKLYVNFSLSREDKNLLVDRLFDLLVSDETSFVKKLYMNNKEITKIAQEGMLGSHCISHEPLGNMSNLDIKTELNDSKNYLSKVTGQEISSVSYPYGDTKAVTQSVIDISRKYYDIGITTQRGINRTTELINKKFSLNRISTAEIAKGNHI